MKSHALCSFLDQLAKLPTNVQRQARQQYQLFKNNPHHPSLQFKRLQRYIGVYSARVNDQYRAIAYEKNGELYWYWIGTHNDYDKMI